MLDIESFCDRFKFGDIDEIFITIYSYFIIGFLILFTTYEQKFLSLELHIQILLSIAISLPVTGITAIIGYGSEFISEIADEFEENDDVEDDDDDVEDDDDDVEDDDDVDDVKGFFYESSGVSLLSSLFYSIAFSLFYIIKHLEVIEYNNQFDPVIAVSIIILTLCILCIRLVTILYKTFY